MEESDSHSTKIAASSTAVDKLRAGVANALNFQPLENADVFFGFDKATLTPQAKVALDQIAQKALAQSWNYTVSRIESAARSITWNCAGGGSGRCSATW